MTTIRFEKPNFALLENNQFLEKNKKLISEILRRFKTGEEVVYIDDLSKDGRSFYYDLLGIKAEDGRWEIIPLPVFCRVFGYRFERYQGFSELPIRAALEPHVSRVISRGTWEEETEAYAFAHEAFERPLDAAFKADLEDSFFRGATIPPMCDETPKGLVVGYPDEARYVVYLPDGGFEVYDQNSQRLSLSRWLPELYKKLGGVAY